MRYITLLFAALLFVAGCDISGTSEENAEESSSAVTSTRFELTTDDMELVDSEYSESRSYEDYEADLEMEALTEDIVSDGLMIAYVTYRNRTRRLPFSVEASNGGAIRFRRVSYRPGRFTFALSASSRFDIDSEEVMEVPDVQPFTIRVVTVPAEDVVTGKRAPDYGDYEEVMSTYGKSQ